MRCIPQLYSVVRVFASIVGRHGRRAIHSTTREKRRHVHVHGCPPSHPHHPLPRPRHDVVATPHPTTGKTSLIRRYVDNQFDKNYTATLGVDFALKVVPWEDPKMSIQLQLWDIAGQERFSSMTRVYYKQVPSSNPLLPLRVVCRVRACACVRVRARVCACVRVCVLRTCVLQGFV